MRKKSKRFKKIKGYDGDINLSKYTLQKRHNSFRKKII